MRFGRSRWRRHGRHVRIARYKGERGNARRTRRYPKAITFRIGLTSLRREATARIMSRRKSLFHPARLSLPRMEPLPVSMRATFKAMRRIGARFSGPCSVRLRRRSSLAAPRSRSTQPPPAPDPASDAHRPQTPAPDATTSDRPRPQTNAATPPSRAAQSPARRDSIPCRPTGSSAAPTAARSSAFRANRGGSRCSAEGPQHLQMDGKTPPSRLRTHPEASTINRPHSKISNAIPLNSIAYERMSVVVFKATSQPEGRRFEIPLPPPEQAIRNAAFPAVSRPSFIPARLSRPDPRGSATAPETDERRATGPRRRA